MGLRAHPVAKGATRMDRPGFWPVQTAFARQVSDRGCPTLPAFLAEGGLWPGHETHLFSPARRPLRFDLDNPFHPRCIVNKATPFPILWGFHQSSLYRIAVDVAQLLDAFRLAPYGKIVIADLPEAREIVSARSFCDVICLSICITTDNFERSGSLISRCTCSGITT